MVEFVGGSTGQDTSGRIWHGARVGALGKGGSGGTTDFEQVDLTPHLGRCGGHGEVFSVAAGSASLIAFIWVIRGQVELDAATILARTSVAGFVELAPRHQTHDAAFVCLVPTVATSEAVGAFAGHLWPTSGPSPPAIVDHVRNAVAKLRSQVLVPECPPDPHSLCRGVVAKGHQMGIHFTNHSPQFGVLVQVGFIVNADQDVFDGRRRASSWLITCGIFCGSRRW
jgi:hypothetical protein